MSNDRRVAKCLLRPSVVLQFIKKDYVNLPPYLVQSLSSPSNFFPRSSNELYPVAASEPSFQSRTYWFPLTASGIVQDARDV